MSITSVDLLHDDLVQVIRQAEIAAEQSARAAPIAVTAAARRSRRNWLARLIAALQESRLRKARAEVARRRHLLPAELELAGDRLNARREQQLPFIRRD